MKCTFVSLFHKEKSAKKLNCYIRAGFNIKYNIGTVEQIKFCGACVHTWPAKFQASKD